MDELLKTFADVLAKKEVVIKRIPMKTEWSKMWREVEKQMKIAEAEYVKCQGMKRMFWGNIEVATGETNTMKCNIEENVIEVLGEAKPIQSPFVEKK